MDLADRYLVFGVVDQRIGGACSSADIYSSRVHPLRIGKQSGFGRRRRRSRHGTGPDRRGAPALGQSSYTQIFGLVNEARGNPVFSPDDKNDLFEAWDRSPVSSSKSTFRFGPSASSPPRSRRRSTGWRARWQRQHEARRGRASTKQLYYSLVLSRQVFRTWCTTCSTPWTRRSPRRRSGSIRIDVGHGARRSQAQDRARQAGQGRARGRRGGSTRPQRAGADDRFRERADFDIADRRLGARCAPSSSRWRRTWQTGVERRPEWKQVESGVAARTAQLELEKAKFFPTFFLVHRDSLCRRRIARTRQPVCLRRVQLRPSDRRARVALGSQLLHAERQGRAGPRRPRQSARRAPRRRGGLELDIRRAYRRSSASGTRSRRANRAAKPRAAGSSWASATSTSASASPRSCFRRWARTLRPAATTCAPCTTTISPSPR